MKLEIIIIRQLGVQSLNIFLMIYAARSLTINDFAFLTLVINLYASLILLLDTGLWSYYQRSTTIESELIQKNLLSINLAASFLGCVLLISGFSTLTHEIDLINAEKITVIAIVVLAALNQVHQSFAAYCEKNFLIQKIALIELIQAIIFTTTIAIVIYFSTPMWLVIIGFLARSVISIFAHTTIEFHRQSISAIELVNRIFDNKLQLRQAILFQANRWLSAVRDISFIWIVTNTLGKEAYGALSWLLMVGGYGSLILIVQQRLYLPYFSMIRNSDKIMPVTHTIINFIRKNIYILYPVVFFSIYHSVNLVQLAFGDHWTIYADLLPYFCASMIFTPATIVIASYLDGNSKSEINLYMNVLWTFMSIILALSLYINPDFENFAILYMITQLSNIIYLIYFSRLSRDWTWLLKIIPAISISFAIALIGSIGLNISLKIGVGDALSYLIILTMIFITGFTFSMKGNHAERAN